MVAPQNTPNLTVLKGAPRQTAAPNEFASYGWSKIPRRSSHLIDVAALDLRRYTAQQILDWLADLSPEVSQALWNVLRLAGGEYDLLALKIDESGPDPKAQEALDGIVSIVRGEARGQPRKLPG